jgi:dnd system-associated protein 4
MSSSKRGIYRNKIYEGDDGTALKIKSVIGGTFAHVLCFAAFVGLENSKSTPLKTGERNSDAVSLDIFEGQRLLSFVYSIPFIAMKFDPQAIVEDEKSIELFESYANAGMKIIDQLIIDHPTDTSGIETIISLVRSIHSDNMNLINKA